MSHIIFFSLCYNGEASDAIIKMTNSIFSLLGGWEGYWRLRAQFRRLSFLVRVRIFGFHLVAQKRKTEVGIFTGLFRAVFWQLAGSVAIVAALYWLDGRLRPLFIQRGWEVPMDDGYTALLTTIAGIGGVFIGLYYTALSSVSGAIYARVPNNIRDLLARDRTGFFYINLLSILTFSCVLLVAFHVAGLGHVQSAAFIVAVFAGVGILSFAQLGRRAFNFFDPTSLSGTVIERLIQSVKMAAHQDPSFQNHAHRLAAHGVADLKTLADICAKETHLRGEPYAQFSRKVILFLLIYQKYRCRIPTASLWFKQKHIHKEWHGHNSMADVSHVAGMPLQPEVARDSDWLESALLPVVRQCFRVNLEDKQWETAHEILSNCAQLHGALAALRQVDAAAKAARADGKIALDHVLPPSESIVAIEPKEDAGIVEWVASLPVDICILYCNALRNVRKDALAESVGKIAWRRRDAVYQLGFPPHLLPCLEELKTHIDFERQVEGKTVTPHWYQAEVVAREEADQFAANAKVIFEDFPMLLAEWGDMAKKSKRLWSQAIIVGAEWRYHALLNMRLHELKEAHDSITGNQRVEGMKWRTVDFSAHEKKLDERRQKIFQRMAELTPFLLLTPRPEWAPDYPGQFMRRVADAAMDALIDNDAEMLRAVFASYIITCFQQFDHMRGKIKGTDWRAIMGLRAAFSPLRDLLSLSGYARLMSELHENPELWNVVVHGWDILLKKQEDSSKESNSAAGIKMPRLLVVMLQDSKLTPMIDAGNDFRFAWQHKVAEKLAQIRMTIPKNWRPSSAEVVTRIGIWSEAPDKVVDHPSKLVRHCAEYCRKGMLGGGMPKGEDIFVLYYLRAHIDSEGADFQEWDDLSRSIERA